jgi:hypothetical protein
MIARDKNGELLSVGDKVLVECTITQLVPPAGSNIIDVITPSAPSFHFNVNGNTVVKSGTSGPTPPDGPPVIE